MKQILHAFGSTIVLQASNFVTGILIARLLGPEHRGELSQIVAWFSFFAPLALLGLNDAIVYFSAQDEGSRQKIFASGLLLSLVTMTIALFVCAAAIYFHLRYLNHDARVAAWAFLSFAPLYQAQQMLSAYFQVGHRMTLWTIVRALPAPAYAVGIVIAVALGHATILGIALANVASLVFVAFIGFYFVFFVDSGLVWPSLALAKRLLNYGYPLILQRLSIVCRDNLDRMVLPFFISSAMLGNYVIAATFAYLVFVVGLTIDLIGFPTIVRARTLESRIATAERFIAATVLVVGCLVIVLAPFSRELVLLLFGKSYSAASALVPMFLVSGALQAIRMVMAGVFKAFARTRSLAAIEALSSAVMIAVLLIFSRNMGAFAGALAHLASAALSIALAAMIARQSLGLSLRRMIFPTPTDVAETVRAVRLRLSGDAQ